MNQPLVSIIIPTNNRKEMLERLLISIFKNTYSSVEIIVVDDASHDGTYAYIKSKFSKNNLVLLRNEKNLFAAASRNVGFRKSKGEYAFFIDDDNVLDTYTISRLVEFLIKNPMVGEVGPVNYSYSNKKKILWAQSRRNMLTSKTNHVRQLIDFGNFQTWDTDDIPNAFMVRANILKKNKIFFREKYGIMYEESDFAYRIKKIGYTIGIVRNAKIYHDIEYSKEGGKSKDYMYHFMEDLRRPYVTARNRIIFHSIYSTKAQFISIVVIWIWIFTIYYTYKILFYSGVGTFSLFRRLHLCMQYMRGNIDGLSFALGGGMLS